MKIAIVGAGALGQIYGVRLAADHDVSWVVRPSRLSETKPFRLEQARTGGSHWAIAKPRRTDHVPEGTDVALITLRFDTIDRPDEDLRRALAAPARTLVVNLSPVFPAQHDTLEELVGHAVVPAMPGVSGYVDDRGVVRHWVPAVAATLIDDGGGAPADLAVRRRLVSSLEHAGLPARIERDVAGVDAATSIGFFPLIASVAIAGSVDGVLADADLVRLVLTASKECEVLAAQIGKPAAWSGLLTKFLGPFTLKAGVGLAQRLYPESVHFVDEHFGPKLLAQHRLMGRHIVSLAEERGAEVPALRALVERLG